MADENTETVIKTENNASGHDGNEQIGGDNPGQGRGFGFGGPGGRGRRGGGGRFGGPGERRPRPNQNDNNEFGQKRRWGGGPRGGDGEDGGFRRGPPRDRGEGGWNPDDRLFDKVAQISGPTFDLAPIGEEGEKKFSNRARLYMGNISPEATEDDVIELFNNFGETSELFINKEKSFGFIKLDYHTNAEKAKRELDGSLFKGKPLKIRFAPIGASIKVKNLTPFVTNELLYHAFSVFGEIEKCTVIVDDRGKSTGEGIVEYARKGYANLALRKCEELCYFLTSSLRPVIVQVNDAVDDSDGLPDKALPKRNPDFCKQREVGPRFGSRGGFEHEYGIRWKQLHELHAQKTQALKQELEIEMEKLETQMQLAHFEHETERLREQIRNREMDRERQKHDWEMRERQAEESRTRMQDQLRNQQDEMHTRMTRRDDEMRRRQQENSLFMQAHQLDSLLKEEEQSFNEDAPIIEFENPPPLDLKDFANPRFGDNRGGHWVKENRGPPGPPRDDFDFQNKRRRF